MIKFLIQSIANAIGFSKTEAKGTLILIVLVIASFTLFEFLKWHTFNQSKPLSDSAELKEWVVEVENSYQRKNLNDRPETERSLTKHQKDYLPYKTAPKTHSEMYRKGKDAPKATTANPTKEIVVRDLNTATEEELKLVRGIGPAFSERIVKYRTMLGGFYDLNQLSEVYGLKPETIEELKKHFSIQSPVKKLAINSDSIKVLARHPYLSYDNARVIISYRKMHGNITSSLDLEKIKALDSALIRQLKPYID